MTSITGYEDAASESPRQRRAPAPVATSVAMRLRENVATARSQERLNKRFAGLSIDMFGEEQYVMLSPLPALEAPPGFEAVWHDYRPQNRGVDFTVEELNVFARASMVLIFSDEEHLQNAIDIALSLSELGNQAPPMFLLKHSASPDLVLELPATDATLQRWVMSLDSGIDVVIKDEPVGTRLALEVNSRALQQKRLARNLNGKINARRDTLQYVSSLQDAIHDTVWDYLRVRLQTRLPFDSEAIAPGMPHTINDLLVGQVLGEGSFGVVCRLVDPSNVEAPTGQVIKVVEKASITSLHGIVSVKRQLNVMQLLSTGFAHPNIAQFFEVYHTGSHLLFRMEDGGSLDLFKRLALRERNEMALSLHKATALLQQCVHGLCHMHMGPQIVHRDVKPENMIIRETTHEITLKFADFDTSHVAHVGTRCSGTLGTFPFIAPEVVLECSYDPYAADIWSLGGVSIEIMCCLGILRSVLDLPRLNRIVGQPARAAAEKVTMQSIHAYFSNDASVDELLQIHGNVDLADIFELTIPILKGTVDVKVRDRWKAAQLLQETDDRFPPPDA